MGSKCCKKVKPENAARMFAHPATVLSKPEVKRVLGDIPKKILEVGAGCLRNALHITNMGHKVTVLEVPRMRNRFPKQYDEFERCGGRLVETLASASKFEIVILTFVIETICNQRERVALLRNIHAHLLEEGTLIVSARGPRDLLTAHNKGVRCGDGYLTPNRSFARSYTKEQMTRLLKHTGFNNLRFLHKPNSTEPEYLHVIAGNYD